MVNIKKIKCKLGEKDLNDLISRLTTMNEALSKASEEIIKTMAQETEKEISNNIAATEYKDGNDDCTSYSNINGNHATVGMKGKQSAYNEFGTGTVGEISDHSNRKNVRGTLNWYNTGVTIRTNESPNSSASLNKENPIPLNGLYWTYMKNGEKHYTQGIPAGKQVYNASESLKAKKDKIIKEKVGEALSKL